MVWQFLIDSGLILFSVINLVAAVWTSAHAVLNKRDTRSVIGWVGLIWLTPLLGSILYFCLGINRIDRRGRRISPALSRYRERLAAEFRVSVAFTAEAHSKYPNYYQLARLVGEITERPLLQGNRVTPLISGEVAYPAMLEAIGAAEHSIALCSYIFDYDRAGREFIEALESARNRGVEVRVLIDDVGSRYSHPSSLSVMQSRGLTCASFLPTHTPGLMHYANLRNHRKILVVDGRVGFTGGMNIREGCRLDWNTDHPVQDLHFRLEGPVVSHLQESFCVDWAFATAEVLGGEPWFTTINTAGDTLARGIGDGPDDEINNLRLTILGALTVAQKRILIVTPYFLPDAVLISALGVAARRGVKVHVVLPEQNNLRLVQWASTAQLWQVLEHGCRVWLSPPPFDHTKIFLVDDGWSLLGSTNWDPRSLRLNFEFNVECYSLDLNAQLAKLVEAKIAQSREVSLADVDGRPMPTRLRDGIARLLSPFL